jgi:hypothetical protein
VEQTSSRQWYGTQILAADGVSILLATVGGVATGGVLTFASAFTYVFVPSMIHGGNGSIARGIGSIGLRTALPASLAVLSVGLLGVPSEDVVPILGGAGAIVGILLASTIDIAALAYKTVEPESQTSKQAKRSNFKVSPGVSWEKGGAGVSLGGTF